jgi:hypothetical protein
MAYIIAVNVSHHDLYANYYPNHHSHLFLLKVAQRVFVLTRSIQHVPMTLRIILV